MAATPCSVNFVKLIEIFCINRAKRRWSVYKSAIVVIIHRSPPRTSSDYEYSAYAF